MQQEKTSGKGVGKIKQKLNDNELKLRIERIAAERELKEIRDHAQRERSAQLTKEIKEKSKELDNQLKERRQNMLKFVYEKRYEEMAKKVQLNKSKYERMKADKSQSLVSRKKQNKIRL